MNEPQDSVGTNPLIPIARGLLTGSLIADASRASNQEDLLEATPQQMLSSPFPDVRILGIHLAELDHSLTPQNCLHIVSTDNSDKVVRWALSALGSLASCSNSPELVRVCTMLIRNDGGSVLVRLAAYRALLYITDNVFSVKKLMHEIDTLDDIEWEFVPFLTRDDGTGEQMVPPLK
jgi:hypothetical protein